MLSTRSRLFVGMLTAACTLWIGSAAALAAPNNGPGLAAAATVTKAGSHRAGPIDIWAVVNSNGTLARGEQVKSAFLDPDCSSASCYVVVTVRDVTYCSYVATIGLAEP